MKYFILLYLSLCSVRLVAQNLVYMVDGTKMPGKITEITAHKVKFKNLEDLSGPTYSRATDDIAFAFNATGSFLLFTKDQPLNKQEKAEFINPPYRTNIFDVVVDLSGSAQSTTVTTETETDLSCIIKGKKIKLAKSGLCCIIRRDGTHQLFINSSQALSLLTSNRNIIGKLLTGTPTTPVEQLPQPADAPVPAPHITKSPTPASQVKTSLAPTATVILPATMEYPKQEFEKKALEKTGEFTDYLKTVTAVNTTNTASKKAINLACDLFTDEEARVDVSNVNTPTRSRYKVRDYLNRLMIQSSQFDKVQLEYANVNYVSKFMKGPDGNYHGTVSFVQTFKGLKDDKVFYGDITKRTVDIIVKPYQKAVNGESLLGWEVFLGDIGVVQTKKL